MTKLSKIPILHITFAACLSIYSVTTAQVERTERPSPSHSVVQLTDTKSQVTIEDVQFEGLTPVEKLYFSEALREQPVGIKKGEAFVSTSIKDGVSMISQTLNADGYLQANVTVLINEVSTTSKRITFVVDKGSLSNVREVTFEGNRVFTDDQLRSQFNAPQEISLTEFGQARLDYELENVRHFIRSKGYLQAKILGPKRRVLNGEVEIIVPVDEGLLYRIGKVTITGQKRFSHEQIVETLGFRRGDIADGEKVGNVLFEDLESLYGNAGYLKYSDEPKFQFRNNPTIKDEGIVDVQINISEGECYKIGLIEFQGNEKLKEQELRRFLLFTEGETYNAGLAQESFNNLEASGLFEHLNCEYAFDLPTNDNGPFVRIVFKMKERQK